MIKAHPKGWAAGFFLEEFGDAFPVVRTLALKGTAPIIRVHALWDSLHRYGTAEQLTKVKADLRKLCKIAKEAPKIRFIFSPYCEHSLKAVEMQKTLDACKKIITNQKVTNIELDNCLWQGEAIAGMINEIHGEHAIPKCKKFIYSFDGLDCYNADTQKIKDKYKNADVFFFWTVSMNLKKKDSEKISVAERLKRAYRPKTVNIEAMAAMKEAKGKTNVPKKITIKPMSEDCGDLKSNKLLIILDKKYDAIELHRNNNKEDLIETIKPYPIPLENGTIRYYAKNAGYKYAKKNLITIKAGGKT